MTKISVDIKSIYLIHRRNDFMSVYIIVNRKGA
jgi:hypothetical protein